MNKNQLRKLLASIQNKLDGKVNKEEGKGLSTNDLTDELKNNIPYTEEEVIFTLPAETIQEEYDKWVEGGKKNDFCVDGIAWNTQFLSLETYYTDYCIRFGGKESLYMYVDHIINDRVCEFEGNDIDLTLMYGIAYFSKDMDISNITDLSIIKKTIHSTEGYSSDNLYVGDSLTVGGRLENSNISKGTLTCGVRNVASEQYSQALGEGTIASSECQHVIGKYNIKDEEDKYAHIVGHGENEWNRTNIHTLDWNGNAWYSGDVYIGGKGKDDSNAKKLATEEYADTNFANKTSIEDGKLYLLKKDGTKLDEGLTLPTSTGEKGDKGDKGDSYVLTESDKTEIANTVKSDMPQLSFNENGELVVTIGDVSKVFTPVIEE